MPTDFANLTLLLNAGEIDLPAWKLHFADLPDTMVPTCRDCLDRKNGSCQAEGNPVDCFLYGSHSHSEGILLKDKMEFHFT